jgi:hypothetical protein
MQRKILWVSGGFLSTLALFAPVLAQQAPESASAEEVEALRAELQQLKEQMKALQDKLDAMVAAPAVGAPAPGEVPAPAAPALPEGAPPPEGPPVTEAPPPISAPSQTSNYFNPSISVIGNFLSVAGSNETQPEPAFSLSESEVSFQAVVDPYARADFFLSFAESGVDVEEGFATFTALPWGLLAKVGRMRTSFGKINTLHLHVLPWPDEPLPIDNLLGSEEGWIGTGVSVSKLIPLPKDVYSELILQVFDGEAEGLFDAPKRSDLAYNGQYRIFSDLSESTNLDVGFSYAQGPNGITQYSETRLGDVYTTFRWKPLRTATYRSASVRGEYIRSDKEELVGSVIANGWFLSAEYQLAKRWFVGGRYEISDDADDSSLQDVGQAVTMTFWPSEFSQFRGELRRRHYSDGEIANEFLLQIQFAIGAHGAHPF